MLEIDLKNEQHNQMASAGINEVGHDLNACAILHARSLPSDRHDKAV
jgi:hypothetical protein